MEPQQLATKIAQLESRVATLEDEGKIVKGEVKQILTEIRTAILVRENPFEVEAAFGRGAAALVAGISSAPTPAPEPAHRHEETPQARKPKPAPLEEAEDEDDEPDPPARQPAKEPIMLRPQPAPVPTPAPEEPQQPNWSLLTIAGLSAWAEEAMRRVGPLRLEILLDLCEAAGHLTPQARQALARVTELELPEPDGLPSTNETVVLLRQLDALVNDDDDCAPLQARRL